MSRAQRSSDPMPFIQVDRAVLPVANMLAQATATTPQHALGSLVTFWNLNGDPRELERLVEAGEDQVVADEETVRSRFRLASGCDLDPATLVTLGLLERRTDGYRIRGMSRYFDCIKKRISARERGRRGGLASTKSRPDAQAPAQAVAQANGQANAQAVAQANGQANAQAVAQAPAQQEDRGQRTEGSIKSPAGPETPVAPSRHSLMVKALVEQFAELGLGSYAFGGRDAAAVSSLLGLGSDEEILGRWRAALKHKGFPTVRTFPELARNWNHFVPVGPDNWPPKTPDTPEQRAWEVILQQVSEQHGTYNAHVLRTGLRPVLRGRVLRLETNDEIFADWCRRSYGDVFETSRATVEVVS